MNSILETNQNITNDSFNMPSKKQENKSHSRPKNVCGLDDYLLELVPTVSIANPVSSTKNERP
jgi:hypothetical protein